MRDITDFDQGLIDIAKETIRSNYDNVKFNHTVAAAVRAKSGKIYVGINMHSIHGACAEQIALGTAVTAGEREFEVIVAVRGKDGEEVLAPCGNCRQILSDYSPTCEVIISTNHELIKVKASELLPCAYVIRR